MTVKLNRGGKQRKQIVETVPVIPSKKFFFTVCEWWVVMILATSLVETVNSPTRIPTNYNNLTNITFLGIVFFAFIVSKTWD